jgi:hypothetical protein
MRIARTRGVPGAARRFVRDRGRVAAVALVAVAAVGVASIQGGAATALRNSLDASWRGLYDILVVPDDATGAIDGMLAPNSLASGTTGISFEQLDAVRAVDGVELAAPIGEIVVPGLKPAAPQLAVPVGLLAPGDAPQAYRMQVDFTTDDGLGERVVSSATSDFVLDEGVEARTADTPCEIPWAEMSINDQQFDPAQYPALARAIVCGTSAKNGVYTRHEGDAWGVSDAHDGAYAIMLETAPQGVNRITLVDPEAEKALLGDAGGFLDPLISIRPDGDLGSAEVLSWSEAETGPFGRAYLDAVAAQAGWEEFYGAEGFAQLRALYAASGLDVGTEMPAMEHAQAYVPLVVANVASAPLSVKVSIESFGDATYVGDESAFPYRLPDTMTPDAVGTPVGTVAGDVSNSLNPLLDTGAGVVWPGADLDLDDSLSRYLTMQFAAVARPIDPDFRAGPEGIGLEPRGYRSPLVPSGMHNPFLLSADPTSIGAEAAYVGLDKRYSLFDDVGNGAVASPVGFVVGTFETTGVDTGDDVDYVPLGAYAPVSTTITGGAHDGAQMAPSVTGLGLVSPETIAIGSLASAAAWGDDAPIGAIRVRVAGISGYTLQAQTAVVETAQHIEELGLRAIIVAGSSPAPVTVNVDGYAFGVVSGGAAQTVGPLGEITQRWSELGAAARAELVISGATLAIALVGLGSTIVLLGAVQLVGIPRRRGQAAALRQLGFTRMRVARWFASEELPGILLIVIVGAGGAWLARSASTAIAMAGVVAVTLVLAMLAVGLGSRPTTGGRLRAVRRSRRIGSRTVSSFGARQALLHPLTSCTQFFAIAVVGIAASSILSVFLQARVEAGRSLLASLLGNQQTWPQIALGVTAIMAGALLALIGRRLELARRSMQWSALRTAGWTSSQIARAQFSESVAVIVPALLVTVGAITTGVILLELPSPVALVAVGTAASLVTAAGTLSVRTRGTRP